MESWETLSSWLAKGIPFIAVIFIQMSSAALNTMTKISLDHGMHTFVFVVYRHAIAFMVITPFALLYERKLRPRMTFSIFWKIFVLSWLEPVIDQNLFFLGMHSTTATYATAMANSIPALTFVLAFLLRLEKINLRNRRSQAKLLGTIVTISGAMVMTFIKGPVLFGVIGENNNNNHDGDSHVLFGSLLVFTSCTGCAVFIIIQAITLESYPAGLSLTSLICFMGTVEGLGVAFMMGKRIPHAAWLIFKWDIKLMSAIYAGVVSSGIGYFLQGVIMKAKGPVFFTAFNPLGMIMVAAVGSILGEQILLGRAIGAFIICLGLFSVVWGKSGDDNNLSREKDEVSSEELKEAHREYSGDKITDELV
ncbi:WAT1-related protein At2g37460-like [Vicia villosa]|uniref:WAT1-related protein At2g37460-like n=1 Tax=Vicia villosa TaxID=3911 RepID=UPI00273CF4D0|nr:WAT1-related protein At2g37460-like [Vicia villosa]